MSKNDGGQAAFPNEHDWGMSLRDYFAGQALMGFSSNTRQYYDTDHENDAKRSYKQADAMIAERDKHGE